MSLFILLFCNNYGQGLRSSLPECQQFLSQRSGRELILVQTLQEAALGLDRLRGWTGSCPSTVGPSTAPRWSPSSLFCGFCYCYYLCYGPSPITWTTPRHGAAQPGYWDVLQALLQEPTDVNTAPLSAVRVPCPIMPSYLIYQMSSKIKLLMISRQFASFFLKALAQVTHP